MATLPAKPDMKDRILETADRLFYLQGIRAVGVDTIAAEIGINHNGDMNLAHKSIDAAADAGADAVKFQNYRTKDFISDASLKYEYTSRGQTVIESQQEMFKRCELSPDSLRAFILTVAVALRQLLELDEAGINRAFRLIVSS